MAFNGHFRSRGVAVSHSSSELVVFSTSRAELSFPLLSSPVNLFFSSWTLNSKSKLLFAVVGIFTLAALTEGVSRVRHQLFKKARSAPQSEHNMYSLLQTGLHGLHALMGYLLMLASMTFSLELFLSVIFGLVFGYVLFGGDAQTHVATNPCCAFLEDEAIHQDRERVPTSNPSVSATLPVRSETETSSECCQSTSNGSDHNPTV